MGLKVESFKFSKLSKDYKLGLKDYKNLYSNGIPLKNFLLNKSYSTDILSGRTPSKFTPEYWNGEYDFITLADVDTLTYNLNKEIQEKITEEAIDKNSNLILVPKNSLIISNAMTVGLAFINDRDVYINQNVFWTKINESIINKKFLLWYFNCYIRNVFQNVYSAKYLSKQELSIINIPNVKLEDQKQFEKNIIPLENTINQLNVQIEDESDIVNDVFSKYFNYDKDIIFRIHKGMTYGTQKNGNIDFTISHTKLSDIKDNKYRLSTRANNDLIQEIIKILKQNNTVQLKDIVLEPIHRGKSPEYDESGDIPVIKTAHISNIGLVEEYNEFVNEEFYNKKEDSQLKVGDILLTSTGKPSIGKITLFNKEYKAIPDGHVSIIRIDEKKYNREFLVYFMQSILGYSQLEKEYVGCTNQIELYADSLNDIILPDIEMEQQNRIVAEINLKLKEQEKTKKEIIKVRNSIENIMQNLLKQYV